MATGLGPVAKPAAVCYSSYPLQISKCVLQQATNMGTTAVFYYSEVDAKQALKLAFYLYPPPPEAPSRAPQRIAHTCEVRDVRDLAEAPQLDKEGFAFVRQSSDVDFFGSDALRADYFPQVEALVREHTGAAEVLAFDYNLRGRARVLGGEDGVSNPVKSVHNDYTETSAPQRVRDLLPERADELLERRFAVINVWRAVSGPVLKSPLGVLSATSIRSQDFIATDLIYRDRLGEVYSIGHSPSHEWYYCSAMERDDVLLLKCYDSSRQVAARFTGHSAFETGTVDDTLPERESIEVRTLAFF